MSQWCLSSLLFRFIHALHFPLPTLPAGLMQEDWGTWSLSALLALFHSPERREKPPGRNHGFCLTMTALLRRNTHEEYLGEKNVCLIIACSGLDTMVVQGHREHKRLPLHLSQSGTNSSFLGSSVISVPQSPIWNLSISGIYVPLRHLDSFVRCSGAGDSGKCPEGGTYSSPCTRFSSPVILGEDT